MRSNHRSAACVAPLAVALLGFTVGCEQPADPIGPESVAPRLGHSPGHGKGGGGGGGGGGGDPATLDLSGGFLGSGDAEINSENKNRINLVGGSEPPCPDEPYCYAVELLLSSMMGFTAAEVAAAQGGTPPATLPAGCTTDPPDLSTSDPGALARMIGHSDDPVQTRLVLITIDKKAAQSGTPDPDHQVEARWWDDPENDRVNGNRYRAGIGNYTGANGPATAVENATDDWTLTGGSILMATTQPGQGEPFSATLICPVVGGSVGVVLTR